MARAKSSPNIIPPLAPSSIKLMLACHRSMAGSSRRIPDRLSMRVNDVQCGGWHRRVRAVYQGSTREHREMNPDGQAKPAEQGPLTPRECVEAALGFEEARPVPYHIRIEPEVEARLNAHHETETWRQRLVSCFTLDHFGFQTEELEDGTGRDPIGVLLQRGNTLHVLNHPLPNPPLRGYAWPDPESLEDWHQLRDECERVSESYRRLGLGFGLFERACLLRGMEQLLMDMIDNTPFVNELSGGILIFHLRVMDITVDRLPIDVHFGANDRCDQRGLIMGMCLRRRFFKPRLARLIARCHGHALRFMCHAAATSCPW
jgi:hypothetical protein